MNFNEFALNSAYFTFIINEMNIVKTTAKAAKLIEEAGVSQPNAQQIAVKIVELLIDEIIKNEGLTKEEAISLR